MRRRAVIALRGGAALALPRVLRAQQSALPVVGVLQLSSAATMSARANGPAPLIFWRGQRL